MEFIYEDVLVVGDEDLVKNTKSSGMAWALKSGPRGLLYTMSIVIYKSNDGDVQVLKNRSGNLDVASLPQHIVNQVNHVSMDAEERHIMSKSW